jgi:hypothetical protein
MVSFYVLNESYMRGLVVTLPEGQQGAVEGGAENETDPEDP